jgi:hypothetical protein
MIPAILCIAMVVALLIWATKDRETNIAKYEHDEEIRQLRRKYSGTKN